MFWDNFVNICKLSNTTPNAICKELKLSNAIATRWKNGTVPNGDTLCAIADYFNISVDYLLGRTEKLLESKKLGSPKLSVRDMEIINKIKSLDFEDYIDVMKYISQKCRK